MKCASAAHQQPRRRVVVRHVEEHDAAGPQQPRRTRAASARGSMQVLEHVEERDRVEAARLRSRRPRAPPSAGRGRAPRPNSTADGIEIDADRLPAGVARRLHHEAGAAADVEIARASATARCGAISADALAAEALDAVVVALDAEVAHDVLVLLRRVDLDVVRLVEGRAHVDQVAARGSARAACGPCRARGRASALPQVGQARGLQQVVGNAAVHAHQLVDRVRALLDQLLVRPARAAAGRCRPAGTRTGRR